MTQDNWKTLRVPPEAYETAKAQKEDNDRTWGEQLVRPEGDDTTSAPTDPEAIAAEFRRAFPYEDIDEMQDTLGIISDRTARIESKVEEGPR
jgi:hypothetical protein